MLNGWTRAYAPHQVLSLAPLIGNLITGDAPLEVE